MAVKIRLKRLGKIRNPQYRIVVADSRTKRDGRAIEEIGKYHPKEHPSLIEVNSERAQYWLGVGAQPSDPVLHLLKLTGDWQRFQGDPNAESKVLPPEPRADRKAAYDKAAKEAAGESGGAKRAEKAPKAADAGKAPKAADADKAPKAADADRAPKAADADKTDKADSAGKADAAEKAAEQPEAKAESDSEA